MRRPGPGREPAQQPPRSPPFHGNGRREHDGRSETLRPESCGNSFEWNGALPDLRVPISDVVKGVEFDIVTIYLVQN